MSKILFPDVYSCRDYIITRFWKKIFYNLSLGKSPYGTFIKNDSLYCTYKNKEFIVSLKNPEPVLLYTRIKFFLKHKLGLMCKNERKRKRVKFDNINDTINDNRKTWLDIKKKNVREYYIEQFVLDMKKKYNLSDIKSKQLLAELFINIFLKNIKPTDIIYNGNDISSINGLILKNDSFYFDNETSEYVSTPTRIDEDGFDFTSSQLEYEWEKYITHIQKCIKN